MITDYDCRNAYIKVDKVDYLVELEKAEQCFKSAENLSKLEDFENAYIILYRGLQFIGNAVLIKKFGLKSKNKNCQFQYLFNQNLINQKMIEDISDFSEVRNHIYYNNVSIFSEINKAKYESYSKKIIELADKLKEVIK